MYRRKWKPQTPDTDLFYRLLGDERTRPTILKLWDQLFEADGECQRIEEYYLGELQKAKQRVQDLEKRFLKDPVNSHKPSSTEPFKKPKRTKSLREKSGQAPGGQPGHEGQTLELRPDPHETRIHPVYQCGRCKQRLNALPVTQYEIRQVIDLKNGKPYVIEHKAEMKVCPHCDSMNHGGFPQEARAYVCYGPEVKRTALYLGAYQLIPVLRAREILDPLFGLQLSAGTLCRWSVEAAQSLKDWENQTRAKLIAAPVVGFDETGIRTQGRVSWLHAASDRERTLLVPHPTRGLQAMSEIGILPDFQGIAVHDGFSSYFSYSGLGVRHALCNAHHLRELQSVEELERERWATEMKNLLRHALHHQHRCQSRGKSPSARWVRSIEKRYERILRKGYRSYRESMPKRAPPLRSGPQEKRDPGHNLLRRLHAYQKETLLFLKDPRVPFTNNATERDLRMSKVKQKISGCFRSWGGALAFFRVRSFLQTALKQNQNPFQALTLIFPPIPREA